jgi:hypothetical protein
VHHCIALVQQIRLAAPGLVKLTLLSGIGANLELILLSGTVSILCGVAYYQVHWPVEISPCYQIRTIVASMELTLLSDQAARVELNLPSS